MLNEVKGQDSALRSLRGVINGRVRTPLLLIGEEGTGRRFSALEAIKEVVSTRGGESSVLQVTKGVHPDVTVVEPDGDKDLGVDPIREVVERSSNYPVLSPYRFFLIDGVDRMTPAAANAILKTLEEPPAESRFFLLAESYDRVIPTIRSRCSRVDYHRLPEDFISLKLSQFESDPNKALVYSRMGEGSVGRALRYWSSNRIVIRDHALNLVQFSANGDLSASFSVVDEMKDSPLFLRFLIHVVHDLITVRVDPSRVISVDIVEDLQEVRSKVKDTVLSDLWANLRVVWERYESSYINLPFQIKSALASTFIGE